MDITYLNDHEKTKKKAWSGIERDKDELD